MKFRLEKRLWAVIGIGMIVFSSCGGGAPSEFVRIENEWREARDRQ